MDTRRRPDQIVFVLPHYGVGGAEKQLANLIHHRPARARSVEPRTITFLPTSSAEVAGMFERAGAENTLVDRSSQSFPSFFLNLVRVMRGMKPLMVSTFLDSSVGAWGRLAALLTGVPLIVHSDRLLATEGSRAHFMLRPHLDRRTKRFLPNAQAIADRLVSDGVPREKIIVMPNGVDLERFDPYGATGMRAELGIGAGSTVLGYLGRFAPFKRVDLLLEAVAGLAEENRPDHLLLAGDGPTMNQAREIVQGNEWLMSATRFLGTVDDTPRFLATIDYLVLPSESEGLPNVVLEAMAMAKPVISTSVSDVPALVADTGMIVPPSNLSELAGAITAMQNLSDSERATLGARARTRIEAEYSIQVAAGRFWDAHLDLIDSYLGRTSDR